MPDTVEWIEALTVVIALIGGAASLWLGVDSISTLNRAVDSRARGSIVTIAMIRLLTECMQAILNWLVLLAGVMAAITPPPVGPTVARPVLQAVWLTMAIGLVLMSVINTLGTRRVLRQIEQEVNRESD